MRERFTSEHSSEEMTCSIDPRDGTVQSCDRAFLKFVGKEEDEVIGRTVHALVEGIRSPDEPLEEWRDGDSKLFVRERDGARFICSISTQATENLRQLRIRRMDSPHSTEDPFHRIFYELSRDIMVLGDLREQRFIRVNPSFYRLLGYDEEEALEKNFLEFCHPEDRESLKVQLQRLAEGHPVEGVCFRGLKKGVGTIWIEWSGFADPFEQLFYAIGRDVDQEVRAKEELSEREQWYSSLFESSPVAKVILDGSAVVDVNQELLSLMGGGNKEDFLDIHPEELLPHQDRKAFRDLIRRVLRDGEPFHTFSSSVERMDGTCSEVEIEGSSILYEGKLCVHMVVHDVSLRKKAERDLEYREAEYRTVVEGIPEGIYMLSPEDPEGNDFRFEFVNQRFLRDRGMREELLIGKRSSDVLQDHDIVMVQDHLKKAFSERRTVEYNLEIVLDGEEMIFSERLIPFLNEEGECIRIIGMSQDVTHEKSMEGELERLALIAQETDNAIVMADPQGSIEWVNEGFTRLTGYSIEEVKGRPPGAFLKGAGSDPKEVEKVWKAIREHDKTEAELIGYSKSGAPHWVRLNFQPILDKKGELSGFFSIQTDITERKMLEDRLRASEKQFRELVENMNEGIVALDAEYNIEYVNDHLLQRLEWLRERVIKANLFELTRKFDPRNTEMLEKLFQERRRGAKGQNEIYILNGKGERVPFLVSGTPIFDDEGDFQGGIAIMTDLSERKETERRVLNAIIQTQESERKRFAEDLHDGIGQILSAAKMQLQSLEAEFQGTAVSDVQMMIQKAIDETRTITHDLMPNELRDFGLIKAVENLVQRMARTHGINVEFDTPEEEVRLGEDVQVAAYRIFQELLANIMKHSSAQKVYFEITSDDRSLRFVVEDDGIGFDTADPKEGVGITNIERRADLFGGSVNISSKPGKGTRVEGRIPLERQLEA